MRINTPRLWLLLALLCLLPALALAVPMTGSRGLMIAPTASPAPTATPAPLPTPPPPSPPAALAIVPQADPAAFSLRADTVGNFSGNAIAMAAQGGYAQLPGVLTFRGGSYRQNAAYGYATAPEGKLEIVWKKKIGALDNWSGVGWNGQPALVQWPDALKQAMNLYDDKKAQDSLIEGIYGTLDGHIYFLDLADGSATRDAINVGFPMKGSISIDPRGVPLLYSGQGISSVGGRSGKIGLRIFSLINGEQLYLLNGRDSDAYRAHGAFDSVALVDAASDTLIAPSENGLLYTLRLNTQYDPATAALSIAPERTAYRYRNSGGQGIENSVAVYGHYAYFTDNGALLQCVDLNTLTPVWAARVTDDSDSSVALDPQADGRVLLFTACEVDKQKSGGKAYMRCFDALTGELLWEYAEACIYDPDLNGGVLASPLVGQGAIGDLVFFHVAKVADGGGALVALDKQTGALAYRKALPRYGWSSPVAVYGAAGEAHIILGDSGGNLRLLDARTGAELDRVELYGSIEGSPAVFGDMLLIGTRGCYLYGVRIR
ncbi:MAG: PQQ-like beta-propeller repeat protein [Oscillospiraceae bacterium]|nr:PQQ-like beta-propeller repeat protein [Oscillospiraceae bacterium]